ncbi:hypothetical protein [Mycetocola zhujimingii]|uniref:hypothetical protein n=1 Tax=Mycetocola zhujimingii TaxID=2079792 RepID=UPI000D3D4B42|nr:hypothetical protein [Mycetocola zhujimingii]AWB86580.1 hypothetical protein C3E77_08085 [Mycetocola zhujimingii]
MKTTAVTLLVLGVALLARSATWLSVYGGMLDFEGVSRELDVQIAGYSKLALSAFGFGMAVLAASGMVVIAYREKLRQARKATAAAAVAAVSPQPV